VQISQRPGTGYCAPISLNCNWIWWPQPAWYLYTTWIQRGSFNRWANLYCKSAHWESLIL